MEYIKASEAAPLRKSHARSALRNAIEEFGASDAEAADITDEVVEMYGERFPAVCDRHRALLGMLSNCRARTLVQASHDDARHYLVRRGK